MGSMGEGELESLKTLCKDTTETLGPRRMETLGSLIGNFDNNRIEHAEFSNSIHRLFEIHTKTQHHHVDTELEDGQSQEHHVSTKVENNLKEYPIHHGNLKIGAHVETRSKVDEGSKTYPIHHGNVKIRAHVGVRVKVDENPKEDVLLKMHTDEQIGRRVMKKRRRLIKGETPNYKLIPEEQQCPVKYEVLNNKVSLVEHYEFEHKKLTEYEEEMMICEEEMGEADVSMESLRSAVEKAEKVIKGEMKVKELGVMFYACIKRLCRVDVFERVRKDYKKALPKILPRLKQTLNELTVARADQKSRLKQFMEEDNTAQGQGQKQHTFVSDFIYPLHKAPR